ncbi:hypothetical protein [uncultured Methanobrevibacter sp.]|uniref:hypothetical protein n=1 Tax=uncultured Methanobrevibacter sp. TaxID=253161 RepID=UPI0025D3665F|nr:hypothetical protein [uncultured Methanobrevibacter sp.]
MEKRIDDSKLKVKYVIGSYRDSDDFPTTEDILYELTKEFCTKSAKELKFTNESLKLRYSLSDDKFNFIINGLIKDNIIEIIKEKDNVITYEIKINKFV